MLVPLLTPSLIAITLNMSRLNLSVQIQKLSNTLPQSDSHAIEIDILCHHLNLNSRVILYKKLSDTRMPNKFYS